MRRARRRAGIVVGIGLAWCACGFALDPSLNISQYAHTAWKVRDGFFKSGITAIAQTPDGYLWLGTDFGLLRFDGVRFVPWQPPKDQHLPSESILALLVSSDGTLWVGTRKGLASWKNGNVNQYGDLDGQSAGRLLEDHEGTIWVGTWGIPHGKLCAIQNGRLHCYGQDGVLGPGILGLYEDSKGNLWIGVSNGVWHWNPGPSTFYPMPGEPDSIRSFVEDDKGDLLISTRKEIRRFVDGKTEPYPLLQNIGSSQKEMMLRDRDGSLWISSSVRGLIHVHQGRADVYTRTDGLSGDATSRLFEDREGSIWVATQSGLDRFRGYAVSTISVKEGLSNDGAWSVLASRDRAVWIGAYGGLNRWENGQITMFGSFTGSNESNGTQKGDLPNALFQDDRGRIWVSTIRGLGYLENGRFIRIETVPGGAVASIAEDKAGDLWICNIQAGLIHLRRDGTVQQIPWAALERTDFSRALVVDPKAGGLWIGFWQGGIVYFNEGHISSRYSAADSLGGGHVFDLRADKDGTLWAATEGGLSRLKDGRVATLTRRNGLPCDAVHWTIEDDDHSVWLYMPCGLVRIARSELDGWMANPNRTVQATVFDSSDGVISRDLAAGYFPKVTKSSDGKLWFLPGDGVSVIDPRHLPVNKLPPPVHIEQVVADGKKYDATNGLRLPPQVRDLTIGYTALSLVSPETVRFRYKLEGQDQSWREVVNGRQVQYSNLAPRNYRFRVMASNNSGVWNEQGASLDFAVAPAYWQTNWFRSLCGIAFLALLWALYRWRVHQLRSQEKRLREVVDTIPAMTFAAQPDGYRTFVNKGWVEYTGMTVEQSLGSGWHAVIHPEDLKAVLDEWQAALPSGRPMYYEARYRRAKDGNTAGSW